MKWFSRLLMLVAFATLVQTFWTGVSLAQSDFDAVDYFRKLDTNGDRRLTKEELNPRASRYLEKVGLRVDDRIRLRDVERALEKNRADKNRAARQSAEKKKSLPVPGFGPPDDLESSQSTGPASFGDGGSESQAIEYSQKTLEMIDYTLRRYDRDQDGAIDSDEMQRGNWGRPSPQDSDTNGDGVLSRDELAMRYHLREQQQQERGSDSTSKAPSAQSASASGQGTESSRANRGGQESGAKENQQSSGGGRRSGRSERDKFVSYSKGMIKRYDKDKDGRLSKAEWKAVRRPPAGADKNGDGYVTMDEYTDALLNAKNGGGNSKRSSGQRNSTVKSPANSSASGGLGKMDSNHDDQIEMHEFSTEWSDKKLQEFYQIDQNSDGVLTPSEWRDR